MGILLTSTAYSKPQKNPKEIGPSFITIICLDLTFDLELCYLMNEHPYGMVSFWFFFGGFAIYRLYIYTYAMYIYIYATAMCVYIYVYIYIYIAIYIYIYCLNWIAAPNFQTWWIQPPPMKAHHAFCPNQTCKLSSANTAGLCSHVRSYGYEDTSLPPRLIGSLSRKLHEEHGNRCSRENQG